MCRQSTTRGTHNWGRNAFISHTYAGGHAAGSLRILGRAMRRIDDSWGWVEGGGEKEAVKGKVEAAVVIGPSTTGMAILVGNG